MLDSIIVNTLWVTVPLLLASAMIWHKRFRWLWLCLCMVFSVGSALYWQVILPSDLLTLHKSIDLGLPILTLIAWVYYGELIRINGGLNWKRSHQFLPVICGALMGEIAATALLAPQAKSGSARVRVVLGTMAGSLLSPIGDANILLLAENIPNLQFYMIPLGLIGIILANPKSDDLKVSKNGLISPYIAFIPVLLLSFLPEYTLYILLECIVLLSLFSWKRVKGVSHETALWMAILAAMIMISTAGGFPELVGLACEDIQLNYFMELPLILALSGVLSGIVVDGSISSIFTTAVMDRALDLTDPRFYFALSSGFALGGVFPLIIGRCFKQGIKKHLLFCLVGILYIWFVSLWLF
jgi:hypothetical protein